MHKINAVDLNFLFPKETWKMYRSNKNIKRHSCFQH